MQAKYAFFMAAGTGLAGFALGVGLTISGTFNQTAQPAGVPDKTISVPAPTPQKMEYGGFVFGKPTNNDGDTLKFAGKTKEQTVRVRIASIDAPESKQNCRTERKQVPCGEQAGAYLKALISGGEVRCEMWGKPTRDRVAAICFVDGQDIGRAMVRAGWAINEDKYGNLYAAEETSARSESKGIWGMKFERPDHWRACNKPLQKGQVRPEDCRP